MKLAYTIFLALMMVSSSVYGVETYEIFDSLLNAEEQALSSRLDVSNIDIEKCAPQANTHADCLKANGESNWKTCAFCLVQEGKDTCADYCNGIVSCMTSSCSSGTTCRSSILGLANCGFGLLKSDCTCPVNIRGSVEGTELASSGRRKCPIRKCDYKWEWRFDGNRYVYKCHTEYEWRDYPCIKYRGVPPD